MVSVDLGDLDLVVSAQLLGRALERETLARLQARGHRRARSHHGYVFQHLVDGPMAIGRIAERMDVSQQAVSKTVAELERLGYVRRRPGRDDRRVRIVALTAKGRRVVDDAREIRAQISAELAAGLGERRAERLRRLLADGLVAVGAAPAIRERRVPPGEA
jgi:DNA-binding MarR family transcriptional regulator